MKNLKLKSKMILFAIAIVMTIMSISIGTVAIIFYQQSKDYSFQQLLQAVNVIKDDLTTNSEKTETNASQIASITDLGNTLEYLRTSIIENERDTSQDKTLKDSFRSLTLKLYNICQTGNVSKAAIYNREKQLVGFCIIKEEGYLIGYQFKNTFDIVYVRYGVELQPDSWETVSAFNDFKPILADELKSVTITRLTPSDKYMSVSSYMPVTAQLYNSESDKTEDTQVGFVVAIHQLKEAFARRLSKLTGADINIFLRNTLSVGTLISHIELNTDGLNHEVINWNLEKQTAYLTDLSIEKEEYFQALFPIYDDTILVGAFSATYSTNLAANNTKRIIMILFGAFLAGIILITPGTLYFSRSMAKPLEIVAEIISKVQKTGSFSERSTLISKDEIGIISASFNGLMDSLQDTVRNINLVMGSVANGDLEQNMRGSYEGEFSELQNNTNQSMSVLNSAMYQVLERSKHVQVSAGEIANSSQVLANVTLQQAATLEEVASSMDEIAAKAKMSNENADEASLLTNETIKIANDGNIQMKELLGSMQVINNSSQEVSKIIKVIDEIAFQTNLLALNAAVEAARAGKYGKGFAVVAEEVRNLAARSAEAASNTTDLIETALRGVENGVRNADLTASLIEKITTGIGKSGTLVDEISKAAQDQRIGIEEINKGLGSANDVIQQNSSISEETASAAEELASQSTQLNNLISRFKIKAVDDPNYSLYKYDRDNSNYAVALPKILKSSASSIG